MKPAWKRPLVGAIALSFLVAACGDTDSGEEGGADGSDDTAAEAAPDDSAADTEGSAPADTADSAPADTAGGDAEGGEAGEITVTGPERSDEEAGALQHVLGAWGDENGVTVNYLGSADWEANVNTQVEAGNPPDISIFPQPGKLADFAQAGHVVPLADVAATSVTDNWSEGWASFGNVDDTQYGVPVKSDVKSLVWYQPSAFAEAGYEVPETWADFTALIEEMAAADGPKPLCVGIESGQATGWPFTDWVEDLVLRQGGPEVYDQWVNHEIPFDDPQIVEAMQTVVDLWADENVFASSGTIAATAMGDNGQPLVAGDCYMHRQASFFASFIPEGTAFADDSEGAIDVFYLPGMGDEKPLLTAGTLAAAFNERPKVHELLAYMGTPEYAEARQVKQTELKGGGISGFLSAAEGQDESVYQPLEQRFLDILAESEVVRFDGSDLMPAAVGAGSFWTEGTSLVNGDIDVATAAANIEASWPSGG